MKLLKRITAVIAAFLIAVNIAVVNISAVSVAPVVAEEFAEVLITLLLGAGHSQSELDGMNVTQMQSLVTDDVNSGKITIDTPITDPVSGVVMGVLEFMNKPENQVARSIVTTAVNDFIGDIISVVDGSVELDERYLVVTSSTIDMQGFGALVYHDNPSTSKPYTLYFYYSDYVVLDPDTMRYLGYGGGKQVHEYSYGSVTEYPFNSYEDNRPYYSYTKFYGDVRYADGTQVSTDDELEYVLGEVDGTKVTPDILNPDGSVTIDGVTYYPADYLDPDALSEEGKNQLINNITNVINNTYVISEDKPIVDEDDITVEVAEELENYTVPTGIITVFPFCLPFDFVRGMKLFSAKPVTPHFEVTINVPAILNIPEQKWTFVIDLGEFETLAKITRWTSLIGFSYLLISLSTKIVKGAGA